MAVKFLVLVKRPGDEHWEGEGEHAFAVAPRVGEFVVWDDAEGKGWSYRVVGVTHPLKPGSNAGDLFVVRESGSTEHYGQLFDEHEAS